ncbi:RNA polymerase sigma factor RpoH [Motiliproteus sp.]|uniref:RNA polymerase sigma factor RpoH n=1 Tax=Motiliproteus sp. TaxID=1898955 RepID=UPI003BAD86A7
MNKALTLGGQLPVSLGNFDALVSFANNYPMVDEGEERDLARKLRDENDLQAAHHLVLSHLRFVVKIARSYKGYGLPLADVAQEGCVGLMKAVRRFDPDMGVRLSSFAVHWIRAEIYEYVLRNWKIVKVATTKAQRKLFFRLRQARQSLKWLSQDEATAVASELDVPVDEVKTMEQRLYTQDLSFEGSYDSHDEEEIVPQAPAHYLEAPEANPLLRLEHLRDGDFYRGQLYKAINALDARQRDIIEARWLSNEKTGLKELAQRHGVSMERIRQVEKAAIKQLSTEVQATFVA